MIWLIWAMVLFSVLSAGVGLRYLLLPAPEAEMDAARRRLGRLKAENAPPESQLEALLRVTSYSEISFLDRLIANAPRLVRLQDLLDKADNPVNLGTLLLLSGVAIMAGAIVGLAMDLGWFSAALALGAGYLPVMAVGRIKKKRLGVFESQFPEAVELVSRALRAGHSFSAGLRMVGEELGEPVGGEFNKTFEDYSFGKTMEEALAGLVARVELEDVKFFASAVSLQRETGGNLTEILDNIAYIIRERFRLLRTVKALSAEGRLSGWILSLMPPAMFGLLYWSTPEYINMALHHPTGQTILVVGMVLEVLGIVVIKQIIKVRI